MPLSPATIPPITPVDFLTLLLEDVRVAGVEAVASSPLQDTARVAVFTSRNSKRDAGRGDLSAIFSIEL